MTDVEITPSSGNVFADLGIANPEIYQLKSRLAGRIYSTIYTAGWTQIEAAARLGLEQADVSKLMRGRLDSFSLEHLLRLLSKLGFTVQINLSKAGVVDEIAFEIP